MTQKKSIRKQKDIIMVLVVISILLLINFSASFLFKRFDLTTEKRYTLSESTKELLKKLDDRDSFISKTPYNEKNAKTLDTMFANSSDIYKQLTEIESQLSEERKSGQIKGGRKESLSERKIL